MIELRDVHKSFGDNHVLRGVNLEVAEGSTMVILGASGVGKSVLLKHIIGLLRPDRGRVIVGGEDITDLSQRELNRVRRRFGMVFQWAALFDSLTVKENVAFPLREHTKLTPEEIDRRVKGKLELVHLEGVEDKYPAELSGGMRKRVGLARAVILDPEIILYDEPTTGLDPITTEDVNNMILTAKERLKVTALVISHDIGASFKVADRMALLHQGVIAAEGSPRELTESPNRRVQEFLSNWKGERSWQN